MRILVSGSRKWRKPELIESALATLIADHMGEGPTLIHGGCYVNEDGTPIHTPPQGADAQAQAFWLRAQAKIDKLPAPEIHFANWRRYGKRRAGIIRNLHMLDTGIDLVLAFIRNRSPGATHCSDEALRRGISVRIWRDNDKEQDALWV